MHETSLMKNLMRRIEEVATAAGARRVVAVSVWVGALTDMSAGHFIEHFEHAAADTRAAGARVDVVVSADVHDSHAQHVLLRGVEVEVEVEV